MPLPINMRTSQKPLCSIYFTMRHLQIDDSALSHFVRNIFFSRIQYSRVVLSRELIFLSGECHRIYGILPKYHFHYKNTCILSRILYDVSINVQFPEYYLTHTISSLSWNLFSIDAVVRMNHSWNIYPNTVGFSILPLYFLRNREDSTPSKYIIRKPIWNGYMNYCLAHTRHIYFL